MFVGAEMWSALFATCLIVVEAGPSGSRYADIWNQVMETSPPGLAGYDMSSGKYGTPNTNARRRTYSSTQRSSLFGQASMLFGGKSGSGYNQAYNPEQSMYHTDPVHQYRPPTYSIVGSQFNSMPSNYPAPPNTPTMYMSGSMGNRAPAAPPLPQFQSRIPQVTYTCTRDINGYQQCTRKNVQQVNNYGVQESTMKRTENVPMPIPDYKMQEEQKKKMEEEVDFSKCNTDPNHTFMGKPFFISSADPNCPKFVWSEAVDFCQENGMEIISLQKDDVFNHFAGIMKGEEGEDLKMDAFWAGGYIQHAEDSNSVGTVSWVAIGAVDSITRGQGHWSPTGKAKQPQPDNFEGLKGGPPENCLAVRNDAFKDGVKFHDESCTLRLPTVCCERPKEVPKEESDEESDSDSDEEEEVVVEEDQKFVEP